MKKQPIKKQPPQKKPAKKVIPPILVSFPFKPLICYSIIGGLVLLLYFNSLFNAYALDDDIVIGQNMYTQQGFKGIGGIMTHDVFVGFFKTEKNLVAGGRYRPLSLVTFAVEQEFFGGAPAVSHFINMLLFALTGIGIFIFLTRLFSMNDKLKGMVYLPLLSAILFVVHPIHTEAVTNIKGRDEVMGLLFAVLAANSFVKFYDTRKMLSLVLGGICYFLSLLSKENAITWLAIIPLLFYFFREFRFKDVLPAFITAFLVAVLYMVLRQSYTNTSLQQNVTEILNNSYYGASIDQKFATIIYTLGKYLQLFIFPHPLTHDYNYNEIPWKSFADVWVLLSLVIWLAFTVLAIMKFSKKSLFSFCFIYFAATFSVVSNVFFNVGTTMSERLVYMSSFSFCIYAAYLLLLLADKIMAKQAVKAPLIKNIPAMACIAVVILGFSIKTIARNPAWKNNYTLFNTDIKTSPNSAKLNNALGGTALEFLDKDIPAAEKKKYAEQAKVVLNKAIAVYPDYNNAWLLLGNAYLKSDSNFSMAMECYVKSLNINPTYPEALTNMRVALYKLKTPDKKLQTLKELTAKYPSNPAVAYIYGSECMKAGLIDSAIGIMKGVLKVKPDYSDAYADLGLMYGQNKQMIDSSIYFLTKALEADPYSKDASDNLGLAYLIKGDYKKSEEVLLNAINRDPNYAKFYQTLSNTYHAMGDAEKSQYYYNKAKELDPEMMKRMNK